MGVMKDFCAGNRRTTGRTTQEQRWQEWRDVVSAVTTHPKPGAHPRSLVVTATLEGRYGKPTASREYVRSLNIRGVFQPAPNTWVEFRFRFRPEVPFKQWPARVKNRLSGATPYIARDKRLQMIANEFPADDDGPARADKPEVGNEFWLSSYASLGAEELLHDLDGVLGTPVEFFGAGNGDAIIMEFEIERRSTSVGKPRYVPNPMQATIDVVTCAKADGFHYPGLPTSSLALTYLRETLTTVMSQKDMYGFTVENERKMDEAADAFVLVSPYGKKAALNDAIMEAGGEPKLRIRAVLRSKMDELKVTRLWEVMSLPSLLHDVTGGTPGYHVITTGQKWPDGEETVTIEMPNGTRKHLRQATIRTNAGGNVEARVKAAMEEVVTSYIQTQATQAPAPQASPLQKFGKAAESAVASFTVAPAQTPNGENLPLEVELGKLALLPSHVYPEAHAIRVKVMQEAPGWPINDFKLVYNVNAVPGGKKEERLFLKHGTDEAFITHLKKTSIVAAMSHVTHFVYLQKMKATATGPEELIKQMPSATSAPEFVAQGLEVIHNLQTLAQTMMEAGVSESQAMAHLQGLAGMGYTPEMIKEVMDEAKGDKAPGVSSAPEQVAQEPGGVRRKVRRLED